jgi:hypothetical protein
VGINVQNSTGVKEYLGGWTKAKKSRSQMDADKPVFESKLQGVMTMEFKDIVRSIVEVHKELSAQASRAVNLSITLRNWLIGCHIAIYELNGSDRAVYGERLLSKLSEELQKLQVSSVGKRQLYHYLKFYQTYPQIVRSLPAQLVQTLPAGVFELDKKVRSLTALSGIVPKNILKAREN